MRSVYFDDSKTMSWVLGINDRNTQYLEVLLSNEIYVKGNCISADGPDYFEEFISKLIKTAKERKEELSESEIFMEYQLFNSEFEVNKPFSKKECSIIVNNKSVYPKSSKQAEFIDALNTNQINFAVGPAGTGKGTITKILAKEMGLVNIDTGATYRCVALYAIRNNIKLEEKDKFLET